MPRRSASAPIVPPPVKVTSRKHARRLTSSYHRITHRLAAASSEQERKACHAELEAMGGVAAYQQASALNTALNSTSRWVRRCLHRVRSPSDPPPQVLEVGAINTQLLEAPGLSVRAIDLRSSHAQIEQCDFFSLPHGGHIEAAPTSASASATAAPASSTSAATLPRAYDAIVCSMVLNCVPGGRKRFEMLVGMRSMLRAGGRAFITLPRSCVDHSFTVTEHSFADALAAVGLPRQESPAVAYPASAKIVYFECVATTPDADAAVRFQRARHQARRAHRLADGADGVAARGRKSAGANFDVDVGGHLGLGVRVPRSFEPPEGGRAAREQAVCREAFLRHCGLEAPAAAGGGSAAASGAALAESHDGVGGGGEAEAASDVAGGSVYAQAIARELRLVEERDPARLDYSHWRWFDIKPGGAAAIVKAPKARATSSPSDPRVSLRSCHWRFLAPPLSEESAAEVATSVQARSGWQFHPASGWAQSAPLESEIVADTSPRGPARRQWRTRRHRRLIERLSSVSGCWWRRTASLGL